MIRCNLSKILFERRMKLKTLEALTGVSYSTLWRLKEDKSRTVSMRALESICRELDVTVEDLFSYVDESAPQSGSENGGPQSISKALPPQAT